MLHFEGTFDAFLFFVIFAFNFQRMHTFIKPILPVVILMSLVSCFKDNPEDTPSENRTEIKFGIIQESAASTCIDNGDEISLFAGEPINAANLKLTYRDGTLQPQEKIYWGEGQTSASVFNAIFPYDARLKDPDSFIFSVRENQSSKESHSLSDLLTAKIIAAPKDGPVRLKFQHRMSRFVISVTNNSGKTISSVVVGDICLSYNIGETKACGAKGNISAYAASTGTKYQIFLAPQTAKPTVRITMSDNTQYDFTPFESGITFNEGLYSNASITIDKDSPVPPEPVTNTTKPWFEMPGIADRDKDGIDDNNSTYYYAYHSFKNGGRTMRNYSVCFSKDHHCAMWVAAPRHKCYEGSTGRTDAYQKDPDIPAQYQFSSTKTGGDCNKGHMLGSEERKCCSEANRQVFYYTNIAPQYSSGFNTGGGGWNILEDFVDTKVCADTLYEVIGCYYEKFTDGYGKSASPKTISFGGRDDVDCPTMFYYALLRTKKGNSGKRVKDCSASELQCVAFVRAHNNSLKGQKVSSREMMSIADLEKLTGFTYFVNVPNAPKDTFSPSDWRL